MTERYDSIIEEFTSIIDFLRFGITEANKQTLYYGHGTDNVHDDILALILGSLLLPVDTNSLLLQARLIKEEKQLLANNLHLRIMTHMPVPYITKQAYFCNLSFYVDERVLIPRSPIAELIENQFSPWIRDTSSVENILDLCTGSGCIGIACCYAFPDALVDASDISSDALAVAKINSDLHGLSANELNFILSNCWENIPDKRYDLIVSNPPYVGDKEMETLPAEYRYEPDGALRATNNGLAIAQKILQNAHHYLSETGILVLEVGNSEEALIEAYPSLPFTWVDFERGGHGVCLLTYKELVAYFN